MNLKKTQEDLKATLAMLEKAQKKLLDKRAHVNNTSETEIPTQEQKKLNRFKQAELLSHVVVYDSSLDKQPEQSVVVAGQPCDIHINKISVTDEDDVVRSYNVKRIKTNNDGLVSFILYSDDPDNPRVHVMFRGTHNKASVRRDLETFGSGPGSISFAQNKQEILDNIKQIVSHKNETGNAKVELNIAGHSLGGADTQMCATAILEDLAKDIGEKPNPLSKIGGLNIMHANAAGVTHGTAKIAEQSLKHIKEKNPEFKVNQYIIHVGGDLVQQGGYTSILSKAKHKNLVETDLLKASVDQKYSKYFDMILIFLYKITVLPGLKKTFRAHTKILFHGKNKDIQLDLLHLNNQVPNEALEIEKRLKHKVLQNIYKNMHPRRILKKINKSFSRNKKSSLPQDKKTYK